MRILLWLQELSHGQWKFPNDPHPSTFLPQGSLGAMCNLCNAPSQGAWAKFQAAWPQRCNRREKSAVGLFLPPHMHSVKQLRYYCGGAVNCSALAGPGVGSRLRSCKSCTYTWALVYYPGPTRDQYLRYVHQMPLRFIRCYSQYDVEPTSHVDL